MDNFPRTWTATSLFHNNGSSNNNNSSSATSARIGASASSSNANAASSSASSVQASVIGASSSSSATAAACCPTFVSSTRRQNVSRSSSFYNSSNSSDDDANRMESGPGGGGGSGGPAKPGGQATKEQDNREKTPAQQQQQQQSSDPRALVRFRPTITATTSTGTTAETITATASSAWAGCAPLQTGSLGFQTCGTGLPGLGDKQLVYQNPDHCSTSFPSFEHIRRQGKLCDVTLKVEDQSFSAHRLVLAATIPYFNGMFLNDMAESKQKVITLQGFDSMALEAFINYAYSGRIVLTNENVQSIMVGSSFLGLHDVKTACAEFLQSRFHPHNVLGIRSFADMLACISLLEKSNNYIRLYFEDVSQSDEFLHLSFEELRDIIGHDDLNVSSEREAFDAVIRWLKHDCEVRKDCLPELLAQVRLPLLSPEYLVDHVAKEELVRTSHQCRDLLDEAKDYHLIPKRRYLIDNIRIRPRCNFVMGHIFAVGGLTKFGDSLSTVEVYDPFAGTWKTSEAMTTIRSRVGVAVHKNKLYAFGGYNGSERLSTVEVYDPYEKSWKIIAPMHCKRSAVGTAALNDYIYVCGGYDGVTSLKTVERYCPETDKWKTMCCMNKHRSAGGVVAFQGYIYALGGHDGLSIYDSVERYDPRIDTWTIVKPMLTRRCRLGIATLNGKLYVCGGYDGSTFLQSVEVYDPKTDTWKYVAPMNVMRSRAALVANMGKLWAIGGYDGNSNLSTVEVYDPETDTWSFAASMYAHEGGVGVGVITL